VSFLESGCGEQGMQLTDLCRGPEVESWFGAEEGTDPAVDNEWPLLPFMALSDGAHVYVPFPRLLPG